MSMNPVVYFEIPVADMNRAIAFYSAVFVFTFEKDIIDHNEMAFFPLKMECGESQEHWQREKSMSLLCKVYSSILERMTLIQYSKKQ